MVEQHQKVLDSVAIGQRIDGDERIILFLKLKENQILNDEIKKEIKEIIKIKCSPRHIPEFILQIKDVPYTINGKKIEIAVKQVINNQEIINIESISNPDCMQEYQIKIKDIN